MRKGREGGRVGGRDERGKRGREGGREGSDCKRRMERVREKGDGKR